jgi:hypothetical protein
MCRSESIFHVGNIGVMIDRLVFTVSYGEDGSGRKYSTTVLCSTMIIRTNHQIFDPFYV